MAAEPEQIAVRYIVPVEAVSTDDVMLEVLRQVYGVSDLEHVEGATDRIITLSENSNIVCPAHERNLVPDACKSCRFLAGEG